nr:MAG TPA: hypothetical protein [Caudoviricetes sp.]
MLVLNGVNPARGVLKGANGGGRKDNAVPSHKCGRCND